jgi:DNA modification methylase
MNFQGSMKGDGTKSANGNHAPIKNDKLSKKQGEIFLQKVCKQIKNHCCGSWYVSFYRLGIDWLLDAMKFSGLKWRSQIIWEKGHINLSNSDYKSTYEPIITGWADDYTPVFYGWNENHKFYGRKGESDFWQLDTDSLWHIARTSHNDLHPTMKPVELVERAVLNSSLPKQRVLDLFGGSGSTIIACEKNTRYARVVELEPKYVQVMIKRWQEFTGQEAIRNDGVSWGALCESS